LSRPDQGDLITWTEAVGASHLGECHSALGRKHRWIGMIAMSPKQSRLDRLADRRKRSSAGCAASAQRRTIAAGCEMLVGSGKEQRDAALRLPSLHLKTRAVVPRATVGRPTNAELTPRRGCAECLPGTCKRPASSDRCLDARAVVDRHGGRVSAPVPKQASCGTVPRVLPLPLRLGGAVRHARHRAGGNRPYRRSARGAR
jgi:hypothetical protein